MSQYSQYRLGNLVVVFQNPGEYGIYRIDSISDSETHPVFNLVSVQSGGTMSVEYRKFDGKYPYITEISLQPALIGFTQVSDLILTNGVIDLINITELEDDVLEETDEPQHTINKFVKLGYAVRLTGSETLLLSEEYDINEAAHLGLLDVHELQNLYADLLPGVELDLSGVK